MATFGGTPQLMRKLTEWHLPMTYNLHVSQDHQSVDITTFGQPQTFSQMPTNVTVTAEFNERDLIGWAKAHQDLYAEVLALKSILIDKAGDTHVLEQAHQMKDRFQIIEECFAELGITRPQPTLIPGKADDVLKKLEDLAASQAPKVPRKIRPRMRRGE